MPDLSNININVTAAIDNNSLFKLLGGVLALIILYFLIRYMFR